MYITIQKPNQQTQSQSFWLGMHQTNFFLCWYQLNDPIQVLCVKLIAINFNGR